MERIIIFILKLGYFPSGYMEQTWLQLHFFASFLILKSTTSTTTPKILEYLKADSFFKPNLLMVLISSELQCFLFKHHHAIGLNVC